MAARITCSAQSLGKAATTARRTVVFDLPDNCTVALYENGDAIATKNKSSTPAFNLDGTSDYPLALFAAITNAAGVSYSSDTQGVKIYSLKIWEKDGGEYGLVHDFRPCVKGDVPGLKDSETGLFHTVEDVSKLSVGGDVERIPDDGFVETVNNAMTGSTSYTGGHYINTGYKPGPNSRIELDYALGSNKGNAYTCWMMKCTAESGTNGDTNQFAVSYSNAGQFFSLGPDYIDQNCGLPASVTTAGLHVRRTAILDALNRVVSLVTAGHTNFTATVPTAPCEQGVTLKIAAAGNGTIGFAPIRIYGLKIYESDVLVHDYRPCVTNGAPGLVSGSSFLKFSWTNAGYSKDGIPTAGGNVEVSSIRDYDAFAFFNGAQSIDTGYRANGNSKFVVDFSFANANNKQDNNDSSKRQQFVFDTGNSDSEDIIGRVYVNKEAGNNGNYAWNYSTNGVYTSTEVGVDHQRRLFTIDALNDQVRMTPNASATGTYNGDSVIQKAANFHDKECSGTVKIGSNFAATKNFARIRLYRFSIWDGETIVRDFVPCVTNGVGCLFDLVEGKAYTSTTATKLSVRGRGYNGAEEWIETPQGFSIRKNASARMLTARAVGATSYKWTRDGEPISGGEDGELEVGWVRGGGVHTYAATPVYDVFGFQTEGTPVSVQVEMKDPGMMLIIR